MLKSESERELVKVNSWKWPRKSRNRKLLKISKITFFFKTSLKNRLITYSSPVQPRRTPKSSKFFSFWTCKHKKFTSHPFRAGLVFFVSEVVYVLTYHFFSSNPKGHQNSSLSLLLFFLRRSQKLHTNIRLPPCATAVRTRGFEPCLREKLASFFVWKYEKVGNETLWQGW